MSVAIAAQGLISFILNISSLQRERNPDFIYVILYSYYAFLLLKWIRPTPAAQ